MSRKIFPPRGRFSGCISFTKCLLSLGVWVFIFLWFCTLFKPTNSQAQVDSPTQTTYQIFVTSAPDEVGAIYHEVQTGQAAWTIAVYYKIDLAELLSLNNLTEDSLLIPGDILLIHSPETPTNTPEPTQELPTSTPTATEKSLISTPEGFTSTEEPLPLTTLVDRTNIPRSTLLSIFLFFGVGLLILVTITILTNFRKY
jgi:LysM repeat protein